MAPGGLSMKVTRIAPGAKPPICAECHRTIRAGQVCVTQQLGPQHPITDRAVSFHGTCLRIVAGTVPPGDVGPIIDRIDRAWKEAALAASSTRRTMTVDDPTEAPYANDYLEWIDQAHKRAENALNDLHDAVLAGRHARPRPVTWQEIADIIGITRQGAAERFKGRRKR